MPLKVRKPISEGSRNRQLSDIDTADEEGNTPLIRAATAGRTEEVRYLLKAGADVHAANKDGWTALHHAARNGHLEIVNALLSAGAGLTATDDLKRTSLHWAAMHGHVHGHNEVVKFAVCWSRCTCNGLERVDAVDISM